MSRTAARKVANRLVEAGYRTVLAGGCVRDRLLGRPVHDIDIATAAAPAQVMGLFERTVPVGESFGVVKVVTDDGVFDVATFRRDVGILDGRHPASVEPASLEQDVERRDFTINALVEDPATGEVLDLVGGRADLDARLVRAIGDPAERFREDALRLLRGVRFASLLGFEIEAATLRGMGAEAGRLARVSGERVREELARMFGGPHRSRALTLLDEAQLLPWALPELAPLRAEPAEWARLQEVVAALPDASGLALVLAALLCGLEPEGERASAGAVLADRLRLSRREALRLDELLREERPVANAAGWSRAHRRRWLGREAADDLLALHAARVGEDAGLRALLDERGALGDDPPLPPPWLVGEDLLARGVPSGPRVGRLLRAAHDLQLEGRLADRDAALAWLDGQLGDVDQP